MLSERLIAYALDGSTDATTQMRSWLRVGHGVPTGELERAINADSLRHRENLGAGNALRRYSRSTPLSDSTNAWDSLAECHAALGDAEIAKALYAKAKTLAKPSP